MKPTILFIALILSALPGCKKEEVKSQYPSEIFRFYTGSFAAGNIKRGLSINAARNHYPTVVCDLNEGFGECTFPVSIGPTGHCKSKFHMSRIYSIECPGVDGGASQKMTGFKTIREFLTEEHGVAIGFFDEIEYGGETYFWRSFDGDELILNFSKRGLNGSRNFTVKIVTAGTAIRNMANEIEKFDNFVQDFLNVDIDGRISIARLSLGMHRNDVKSHLRKSEIMFSEYEQIIVNRIFDSGYSWHLPIGEDDMKITFDSSDRISMIDFRIPEKDDIINSIDRSQINLVRATDEDSTKFASKRGDTLYFYTRGMLTHP
ncbi:MAG: hypothetical protein MUE46_18700 [Xanthomonadales bacterium]|jgi:hypothetical protein|nr:hypothetical protein [Xanthomonadales bacterium]